jgi:hypothetical protein
MRIANTITAFERDRVDKHTKIREKQLVIEMEHRTMQIINEKKKEKQEKEYHTMLKEITEEKDFKFTNLHVDRKQHYQKVQDKYATLDKLGYVAFEDHIIDVEARQEQAKKLEQELAVEAHYRSTLADQHYVNRHSTLQARID